jgi:cytochrome c553
MKLDRRMRIGSLIATLGCLLATFIGTGVLAQPADAGRRQYESVCARCHGGDGNGGEMGPAITTRLPALSDAAE